MRQKSRKYEAKQDYSVKRNKTIKKNKNKKIWKEEDESRACKKKKIVVKKATFT